MTETRYGKLEQFDRWIEHHIWQVLIGSMVVAGGLMLLDTILP